MTSLSLMTMDNPTPLAVRAGIDALEQAMEKEIASGDREQTLFDAATQDGSEQGEHYFAEGVFVRSVLIPAGEVVIGRLHYQSRVCMVMSGKCTFINEQRRKTVTAPWIGEFKAGSKTAVYAHSDCLWAACVGTDITDPIEAVSTLSGRNHTEYQAQLKLASQE